MNLLTKMFLILQGESANLSIVHRYNITIIGNMTDQHAMNINKLIVRYDEDTWTELLSEVYEMDCQVVIISKSDANKICL